MIPGLGEPADADEIAAEGDEPPDVAALREQAGRNRVLIRRQRIALIIACVCALASVGGLVAARFVRSPQQQAASVGPPKASVLTAPVQERVLSQTLILRGTVVAAQQVQVQPTTPSQGSAAAVVTAVRVKVGQTVHTGQVLLEVAGRPVIALPGAVPAYRDLKPGDTGRDVTELQRALASLGDYDGRPSGSFGWATKQAVSKLYQHLGYDLPTTGGPNDQGDQQALQAAQNAVTSAQRAVNDMKLQITAATTQASRAPASAAPTDTGQEPLSMQLQYLQQALDQAVQAQNELIDTTGPEMPLSEFVFVPAFPARVETLTAAVGQTVTGPVLTLSTGRLDVSAQLQPDQASLVKHGVKVIITSETLGDSVPGTLATIGAVTTAPPPTADNTSGVAGQASGSAPVPAYVPITVTPTKALSSAWAGQDVRLNFSSARTARPVLAVPVSAVSTGADGTTSVTTFTGGKTVRIPVRAGVSADGYVQITATGPATLTAGTQVVVGR